MNEYNTVPAQSPLGTLTQNQPVDYKPDEQRGEFQNEIEPPDNRDQPPAPGRIKAAAKGCQQVQDTRDMHLTIPELCELYKVSRSSVYELARTDPSFPAMNVGRKKKLVVNAAAYEAWVRQRDQQNRFKRIGLRSADELLGKDDK